MNGASCVCSFFVDFSALTADLSFLPLLLPIETGKEVESASLRGTCRFSLLGDLLSLFPDGFVSLKSETWRSFRLEIGEKKSAASVFLCRNFLPLLIFSS